MASSRGSVTVIIPAFNEESCIGDVIQQLKTLLLETGIPHEIIVVDDGSEDETSAVAERSGARVVRHTSNLGYGAALKTGVRSARHESLLITDADATYPVDVIPDMLEGLRGADMVIGARTSQNSNIPLFRRPAKWLLRRLAGYITGAWIPDLNSGLRVFRRAFVEQYFHLLPDKFSFTTTLTVAALCDHYKLSYITIDYAKRSGKSKIVPWDFVSFMTLVLRLSMLFNPLKLFVPIALMGFLFGVIKLAFDLTIAFQNAGGLTFSLFTHRVISTSALILLLSSLQILLIGMMSDGLARKIAQRMPAQYKAHFIENLDGDSGDCEGIASGEEDPSESDDG